MTGRRSACSAWLLVGIDGGVNVYAIANRNPLAFIDPYGLYNQAVDYWADISVNHENVFARAGASVMGVLAGDFPDIITIDSRLSAGLLSSGEAGVGLIINLNDFSVSGYDSRGLGVGTPQRGGALSIGLGWNHEISAPDNSTFDGVFHEYSASWARAPISETASIYHGSGWFGMSYGVQKPAFSAKYSATDYDVWNGSDAKGVKRPWYDIISFGPTGNEGNSAGNAGPLK